MIRTLRSRHLVMFALLGVLLPVGYAAGLAVRPEMPASGGLAPGRYEAPSGHVVWQSETLWDGLPIATRRFAGGPPPGGDSLEIEVGEDLGRPDLLLYWSSAEVGAASLPDGAVLLGSVAGAGVHRFDVPEGQRDEGELLLYSLAHQEIVGRAPVSAR